MFGGGCRWWIPISRVLPMSKVVYGLFFGRVYHSNRGIDRSGRFERGSFNASSFRFQSFLTGWLAIPEGMLWKCVHCSPTLCDMTGKRTACIEPINENNNSRTTTLWRNTIMGRMDGCDTTTSNRTENGRDEQHLIPVGWNKFQCTIESGYLQLSG